MLTLGIRFVVSTTILYFLCKVAVGIAAHQAAYYDSLLAMMGG